MNLVISICEHEKEMAHRWFDWIHELGGTDGHNLYLIPSKSINAADIITKAYTAFHGGEIITDFEGSTSDWQDTDPMRSAAGPNSSFRQVAWHFYLNKLGPYFWCELDCIPLRKDWLLTLETQYKIGLSVKGKPFMGAHVQIENVPEHMSGCAVYPQNVPEEAPTLVMRTEWTPKGQDKSFELAFDIAGARETVTKAHFTNLIQHKFRHPGFKSRKEFEETIDPNAVVFHSDKSGSIFQYLRQNLSGKGYRGESSNVTAAKSSETEGNESPSTRRAQAAVPINEEQPAQKFGSDELQKRIHRDFIESGQLPDDTDQRLEPPWKNKAESEREVRLLCSALALFAKAPVYKARVRQALRDVKIIK